VLTQTLPEDLAEAMSESDAVYAGGLEADLFAGADEDAATLFELGVAAGAVAGVGFVAGTGLLAGALAVPLEEAVVAPVEESAFLLLDFGAGVESAAVAGEASPEAASAFLLLLDFLGVVESAAAVDEASAEAASAFLLLLDFLVVVESAVPVDEASAEAASAFLLFFDFFVVVEDV